MQNINETRKRFIKVGKRHAEAVNLARHGKFSEALKIAEEHGLTQPKSFVSSMERLSRSLTADIPSYRVEGDTVFIPHLSWDYRGKRQVARLDWYPSFGLDDRSAAA